MINFLGTASLLDETSLVFVLWFSVGMCILSFINALLFCYLDYKYEEEVAQRDCGRRERPVRKEREEEREELDG